MRVSATDPDDLGDVVLVLQGSLNRATLVELIAAIFTAVHQGAAPQRLRLQLDARFCSIVRTDSATPSRLQTSVTCLVISISARDGVASPDGWLWTRTQPVAWSSIARRRTSRGYTGV